MKTIWKILEVASLSILLIVTILIGVALVAIEGAPVIGIGICLMAILFARAYKLLCDKERLLS